MHHVTEELARREADPIVKLVVVLLVDTKDALISFKEGKRSIML